MKVREIMTAEVATAMPDTTLEEIATMMRDEDTGVIPIVDDEELVGLITDRDIVIRCIAKGKDASEITAAEILSEDLETVEPDDEVEDAARLMSGKQVRRLPVVENGRLCGMISLGDIAVKAGEDQAADALEEVSHGVKQSRKPAKGRRMGVSAERRLDQERGENRLLTGGRNTKQGIANRRVEEEVRRQRKVVPFSNEGKRTRKRRAS